jgi:DNA-binding NarL/FixJ family response regulator
MASKISILAAEPNYLVRMGLESLLAGHPDFELLTTAQSLPELKEALLLHCPDVLIVDYNHFPEGIEVLKTIRDLAPAVRVLVITDPRSKTEFNKALESGTVSFLLRECDREEIIEAILKTARNRQFFCGRIVDHLLSESNEAKISAASSCQGMHITEREIEIIRLVAEGLSNKEVAEKLFLSTHTVTTHRKNIMNKLQVNNTAGLVLYAVRNDLLGSNKFLFS